MDICEFFKKNKNVTVAVSGGVDSAVLLFYAVKYAENVNACFVKTELQPQFEEEDAAAVCNALNVPLKVISLSVLDNNNISSNPSDRCYYCKRLIFENICNVSDNGFVVIEGTNYDDDVGSRPGFKALFELGVQSPLRLCKIIKAQIRKTAEENLISVYNKPSYACLATRVPTGVTITEEILNKTEKVEKELRAMSFSNFRIRYDNGKALLELNENDRNVYLSNKKKIDTMLKRYYNGVVLSDKVRK